MLDLRVEILRYFKDEYTNTGQTPSVRGIRGKFGLDNKTFYRLFPEGLTGLCKETSIPIPEAKFKRIEKAMEAKRTIKKESDMLIEEDREFLDLRQKELALAAKVQEAKKKAEQRQRMRKLAFQLASTSYGRAQIFSHPKALLEWCEVTLENQTSPTLLDQLRKACEEDGIQFEKHLWEIVGGAHYPQYYESILRREGLPLDRFVREEVECYLRDREKEQTQKTLQKRFSKSLMNARCPKCDKPICSSMAYLGYPDAYTFLTIEDRLRCYHCNTPLQAICPGCGQPLDCKGQSFWCKNCDLTFHFQDFEDLTRKSVNTARAF